MILPLLLGLFPHRLLAEDAEPEAAQEYVTVRELMRLEAEQALAAARERKAQGRLTSAALSGSVPPKAGAHSGEQPRLVGIYGVGKRLFAEVRAGSQAWVFLKGQRDPVGHTAPAAPYRLRDIAGACVRLEHQGAETQLCLSAAEKS